MGNTRIRLVGLSCGSAHGLALVICSVLGFLAVGPAHARAARSGRVVEIEDDSDVETEIQGEAEAKALFRSALKYFQAKKYDLALKDLLEAKELIPRKSIQLNIARTYQALGDDDSAREAYSELIEHYSESTAAKQELTKNEREEAEQGIAAACAKLLAAGKQREALDALLLAKQQVIGRAAKSILVNIGHAHEALGDEVAAYDAYRELLEAYGPKAAFKLRMNEKERSAAEADLARVRRKTGILQGIVAPSEATIKILGTAVETVSQTRIEPSELRKGLRKRVGKYALEFSKSGFLAESRDIEIMPDGTVTLDVVLRPEPPPAPPPPVHPTMGEVVVTASGAERAALSVDGEQTASLPWKGTLPEGEHVLRARAGDALSEPRSIQVKGGESVSVEFVFQAPAGPPPKMEAPRVPPSPGPEFVFVAFGTFQRPLSYSGPARLSRTALGGGFFLGGRSGFFEGGLGAAVLTRAGPFFNSNAGVQTIGGLQADLDWHVLPSGWPVQLFAQTGAVLWLGEETKDQAFGAGGPELGAGLDFRLVGVLWATVVCKYRYLFLNQDRPPKGGQSLDARTGTFVGEAGFKFR